MIFEHWRNKRRLSLLAMGALGESEAETLRHIAACPRCAAEFRDLEQVANLFERDPVRNATPPMDQALLARLTLARLDRALEEPRVQRFWRLVVLPAAAAAALAALVLVPRVAREVRPPRETAALEILVPEMALRRMERNVAREQAVRYLNDAQDVLVTVASTPQLCDRQRRTLDLAEETRRSRDLLSRRAMLVDLDSDEVRAARPILEDVERVLREVAVLDPCARPQDLEAIHTQLREGRLLMKINLMTRELQG